MASIGLEGRNSEKLKPITFEWSPDNVNISTKKTRVHLPQSSVYNQYISGASYNPSLIPADIDGDGYMDFIKRERFTDGGANNPDIHNHWVFYRNTGSNYVISKEADFANDMGIFVQDIDNNGTAELFVMSYYLSNVYLNCYKYSNNQLSRSAMYDELITYYYEGISLEDAKKLVCIPGDFDGDGDPDILVLKDNAFYKSIGFTVSNTLGTFKKINMLNFDGDAKPDLLLCYDNEYKIYTVNNGAFELLYSGTEFKKNDEIKIGDFNGDGLSDVLVGHKESPSIYSYTYEDWEILVSNGNALLASEFTDPTFIGTCHIGQVGVFDLNEDGKSDISFFTDFFNAGNQQVWVSNGKQLQLKYDEAAANLYDGVANVHVSYGNFISNMGNEILVRNQIYDKEMGIVGTSIAEDYKRIVSISPSIGPDINIDYDFEDLGVVKLTSRNEYENYYYSLSPSTNVGVKVVKQINSDAQTIDYEYGKPVVHKKGRGFLGYESNTQTNLNTHVKNVSIKQLNTSFNILLPYINETYYGEGSDILAHSETFDFTCKGYGYQTKSFSQLLLGETTFNVLDNTKTIVKYSNYDNYNNVGKKETTYLNGSTLSSFSSVEEFTYTPAGAWCDSKPTEVKTTFKNGVDSNIIRFTNYTYDADGRVTSIIKDSTDPNKVTKLFEDYNDFGKAETVKVVANGVTRKTMYDFTTSGRFVSKITDPLDKEHTYHYNEETGLLDYEEDYLGLTTSYEYDGFGRLKKQKNADGTFSVSSLQWCDGTAPEDAVYYSYAESSGSSPVWTYVNELGQEIRKEYFGFDENQKLYVETEYDEVGRVHKTYEPAFLGNPNILISTIEYDELGRIESETTPKTFTTYGYPALKKTVTVENAINQSVISTSTQTYNEVGHLVSSDREGKSVTFTYWPSGQPKTSTPQGGVSVQTFFDLQGNRTKLIDPDAGTVEATFNGFGEQLTNVFDKGTSTASPNEITTTNIYDGVGRLSTSTTNGVTTAYTYDNETGFLTEISNGTHKINYVYDENSEKQLGRVTTYSEELDGKTYTFNTTFDTFGREKTRTFPDGYAVENYYSKYGHLRALKDNQDNDLWEGIEVNERGQYLTEQKGNKQTYYGYDSEGLPDYITSAGIIDMHYSFDEGVLQWRKDQITNQTETFGYTTDEQLNSWNITGTYTANNSMGYDNHGNITSKSDIGYAMNYNHPEKKHAITSISGNPASIADEQQDITYNDFGKVATINEGSKTLTLTYGIDQDRRRSVYNVGAGTHTKYYMGDYEELYTPGGDVIKYHYIAGGNGLAAIYVQENTQGQLYYTYSDYQGSLLALTNDQNVVLEKYAYDPWGTRRNPTNWTLKDNRTNLLSDRGYTLHEHLDGFALINMNGRVYDPSIARFLSPDPQLQAPGNWLNYNRYAYCYNNPLIFSDPSGEFILFAIGVGMMVNTAFQLLSGNVEDGKGFMLAMGVGAASGAAGFGAGALISGSLSSATTLGGTVLNGASIGAGSGFAGGFVGGAGNAWSGGASFHQGFEQGLLSGGIGALSGAIAGGISSGIQYKIAEKNFYKDLNIVDDNIEMDGKRVVYNSENAKAFWKAYFSETKGLSNMYADGTEPPEGWKDGMGQTVPLQEGTKGSLSDVYLKGSAFRNKFQLYNAMGHEAVHVSQVYEGYVRNLHGAMMEYGAYMFNDHTFSTKGLNLRNSWSSAYKAYINSLKFTANQISKIPNAPHINNFLYYNLPSFKANPF